MTDYGLRTCYMPSPGRRWEDPSDTPQGCCHRGTDKLAGAKLEANKHQ